MVHLKLKNKFQENCLSIPTLRCGRGCSGRNTWCPACARGLGGEPEQKEKRWYEQQGNPKQKEECWYEHWATIENHLSIGFEELFTSLRCQASLLKFCDCRGNLLVHNVLVSLKKPAERCYCFLQISIVIVIFLYCWGQTLGASIPHSLHIHLAAQSDGNWLSTSISPSSSPQPNTISILIAATRQISRSPIGFSGRK